MQVKIEEFMDKGRVWVCVFKDFGCQPSVSVHPTEEAALAAGKEAARAYLDGWGFEYDEDLADHLSDDGKNYFRDGHFETFVDWDYFSGLEQST